MLDMKLIDLQLFAEAGTNVNTTLGYRNAYTGDLTPFVVGTDDLSPTMKTFYKTGMLKNAKPKLVYAQLGKKQPLPSRSCPGVWSFQRPLLCPFVLSLDLHSHHHAPETTPEPR